MSRRDEERARVGTLKFKDRLGIDTEIENFNTLRRRAGAEVEFERGHYELDRVHDEAEIDAIEMNTRKMQGQINFAETKMEHMEVMEETQKKLMQGQEKDSEEELSEEEQFRKDLLNAVEGSAKAQKMWKVCQDEIDKVVKEAGGRDCLTDAQRKHIAKLRLKTKKLIEASGWET